MDIFAKSFYPPVEEELKETIEALDSKLLDAIQRYELYQDRLTMFRNKIPEATLIEVLKENPWIADWFDDRGVAK
jgi:hypothetical protein